MIARASRNVQRQFLLRNGADGVVYPEEQLAAYTKKKYGKNLCAECAKAAKEGADNAETDE